MIHGYADDQYRKSQVMTAGRARLLLMTYDGGLRFLRQAIRAMEEKSLEEQHTNITKAQGIVLELLNSLDHSANKQIAASLDSLYRYIYDRLTEANVNDNTEALREAEMLFSRLRETWVEAEARLSQGDGNFAQEG
ncbi:MAG: flagellar export chaperone FliS [Armatimonadetes bacterium]|nr:flagellar export chaperone FliS [Armatimonadota bacterium]NIM24349.1 flagellar export chaperone FliS [Armatimonadota bacterium]NIM68218.1 flagellar export chaperone FliS [Armatimonadota bacterium]NIM75119.1 flagellar export chaperone FliS [Armatimonadota bacterium]NIN06423.1 flagellar export chaperone FliS [Armatimonadota bacterium]